MSGNPWYVYLLGYVFGIVFGHFPISKTMADLREGIGIKGKEFSPNAVQSGHRDHSEHRETTPIQLCVLCDLRGLLH